MAAPLLRVRVVQLWPASAPPRPNTIAEARTTITHNSGVLSVCAAGRLATARFGADAAALEARLPAGRKRWRAYICVIVCASAGMDVHVYVSLGACFRT